MSTEKPDQRQAMRIQIKSRFDDRLLFECEAETMLVALQMAVAAKAYLGGAYLGGAYLRGADLRGADLRGAYLGGADLGGAKINWQSHALIAEILRRAAGDSMDRRCLAGCVLISTDWCWEKLLSLDHPEKQWALETLAPWVQDGDGAPQILKDLKAKGETK